MADDQSQNVRQEAEIPGRNTGAEPAAPGSGVEPEEPPPPFEPSAHSAARVSGPSGEPIREVLPREHRRMNRRELLKLAPVAVLGAFAIPQLQQSLLMDGLNFSGWASGKLFSKHRLEPTYSNSEVAPFNRFPYNFYDVLDPEIDFASWTLTVEGLVKRPGEYTMQQIQGLPKIVQNTRHVCVEGWDVVGNFGGTRASPGPTSRRHR